MLTNHLSRLTGAGASVMESLSSNTALPTQMVKALDEICTAAIENKVKILVDAEQQSVQKGIDAQAMTMMRKYNSSSSSSSNTATVYNTYQAYLKSTPTTLQEHMTTASSENFALGVKLVRGAYMGSEPRHLIHDTKADTDACYDGLAKSLLKQESVVSSSSTSSQPTVSLFLATHNKDSATLAYTLHSSRVSSRAPTINTVQYGQLLGMADEVSCSLLQLGQVKTGEVGGRDIEATEGKATATAPQVYKCLSWGPLEDCMSYLLRRARENKDAVGRSKDEYRAVWKEVGRRTRGLFLLR